MRKVLLIALLSTMTACEMPSPTPEQARARKESFDSCVEKIPVERRDAEVLSTCESYSMRASSI